MERHEKILGDDRRVYYLDCGESFIGVQICQNIELYTFCATRCMQLYDNKAVKRRKNNRRYNFTVI